MRHLHQRLHLYADDEFFLFVPINDGVSVLSLAIRRVSGEVLLTKSPPPSNAPRPRVIYGVIGIISLLLSEYVIVLTGRELRGRLMGYEVYRATEFDILPLDPKISIHHHPHPVEAHLLALVRSHFSGGNFILAYEWDVTSKLQAQWERREPATIKHLWEMAEDRFFWNRFLQSKFIEITTMDSKQDIGEFILPIMYGTFDLRSAIIERRQIQLCLISRRSRFRSGTRYFRRGIDYDGHVANFNETEQLLLVKNSNELEASRNADNFFSTQLSFVQIRGSVPLFWAEVNTLRYKPDLQIMDFPETVDIMRIHFQKLVSYYGNQVLVNLVNQKGYEKPVKEAYERFVNEVKLPSVRYQYFDFHNECKNMRWDRISVLIDRMKNDLIKHGYFELEASQDEPVKSQSGAVRTNCMDNLDRTNVVQAALAKWILNQQLGKLGILPPGHSIDEYPFLSKDFREMWADHADAIAFAYGGSGALKADFTRTNNRTYWGLLDDGLKSMLRYLRNNYFDGPRQDAFDLISGAWVPRNNPSAAMFLVTDTRLLFTRSVPAVASFSLFMIFAGLTLPRSSDYSLFYYFMLWLILLFASLNFILIHGIDYVSWPRLVPLTNVIYYTGPGYRSGNHGKGFSKNLNWIFLFWQAKWNRGARSRGRIDEMEFSEMKQRVD